ncbi:MAG TPA: hypothetical protein VGR70_10665 [Stellaceae bacterium]|nr:hypothetical protein [Stellaceae bacterium]
MSASPPNALSNVLRRISNEPQASEAAPEASISAVNGLKLYGFDEPVATIPEPTPEPAPEDIVALLAEQPEVARLVDAEPTAVEEGASAAPNPPVHPYPEDQPEVAPSRAEVLIAQLSSRVGPAAPRPVRSAASRQAPEPAQPAVVKPAEPSPHRSVEAPDEPGPSQAPVMDRTGRQSLSRNRRLYRRVRLGAEIEINGASCDLIDVSIGGFATTGVPDLAANTIVPVSLRLSIDGIEVGTRLNARIIYAHRERLSGRFIDLTPSQTALLRYIVTWRGESVGMVGTTTLLDAITAGHDQGYAAKSSNGSRERWWAGLLGWKVNPPPR